MKSLAVFRRMADKKTPLTPLKKETKKKVVPKTKKAESSKKPIAQSKKTSAPISQNTTKKKPLQSKKTAEVKTTTQSKAKTAPKPKKKPAARQRKVVKNDAVTSEELSAIFAASQNFEDEKITRQESIRPKKKSFGLKKILLTGVAVLLLAVTISLFYFRAIQSDSLAPQTGQITLTGLSANATISRDNIGVPYISAANEEDLFFATGYAMASDRLWQMYFLNMLATGRTAELLGKKTLPLDHYMRLLGFKRYGDKIYNDLPVSLKKLLTSFAAGVNEYLRTAKGLPLEFRLTGLQPEPWLPENSIYLYNFFSFTLAGNMIEEADFLHIAAKLGYEKAAYLFPIYEDEPLAFDEAAKLKDIPAKKLLSALAPLEQMKLLAEEFRMFSLPASNNWALHPTRTQNGKSLLANDTHLQLTMPSAWYIANMKSPTYQAAGVLLPGVPFVALGFNGKIAWGATMVMGDNQDLFLEKLKDKNSKISYLDGNRYVPTHEIKETFFIKGGEKVEKTLHFTKRGPIISDVMGEAPFMPLQAARINGEYGISLRNTIADGDRAAVGFYRMAKASTIEQAHEALSYVDGICLNIVMADSENIAWQVTGKYPIRTKGRGFLPSPGYTGEYDWAGYHKYSDNPFVVNPPEGFLVTANSKTLQGNQGSWLTNSWFASQRERRAKELLSVSKKYTVDDMHNMHADQLSLFSLQLKKMLTKSGDVLAAIEALPENERNKAQKALSLYAKHDGNLSADSASAALHGVFLDIIAKNTFGDELVVGSEAWQAFIQANMRSYGPVEDHLIYQPNSPFWDNINTPEIETREQIIAQALADSVSFLENKFGKNITAWQWGKIHTYTWSHDIAKTVKLLSPILSRGPYPAGGDEHTLNVAASVWGSGFNVYKIPAMRLVVDFSREEPAELITHGGISGNSASPHYDDLIKPFLNVTNQPLPLGTKAAQKQYGQVLQLEPTKNK